MDQYIVCYLSDRSLLTWVFGHVQRRINLYGVQKKTNFLFRWWTWTWLSTAFLSLWHFLTITSSTYWIVTKDDAIQTSVARMWIKFEIAFKSPRKLKIPFYFSFIVILFYEVKSSAILSVQSRNGIPINIESICFRSGCIVNNKIR